MSKGGPLIGRGKRDSIMLEVRSAMTRLNVNLPEQTYHLIMEIEKPEVRAHMLLKLMEFTNPKMRAVEVTLTDERQPMSLEEARKVIANDPGSKQETIDVVVEDLDD